MHASSTMAPSAVSVTEVSAAGSESTNTRPARAS